MKKLLIAILLLFPGLAFAQSNFQQTPNPVSACVSGIRTYPAPGSTVSGVSSCYSSPDDLINMPYWNVADTWTATNSLQISLLGSSSTVTIGNKYLYTIMAGKFPTGAELSYATCPRYILNADGVRVGTNYWYLNGGTDVNTQSSPGQSGSMITVTCGWVMNATTTNSTSFAFETGVASRPEFNPTATGTNEISFDTKMYAIFATSTPPNVLNMYSFWSTFASTTAFIQTLVTYTPPGGGSTGSPDYLDCSGLDIFCYLSNAFQYVFYPSEESVDQFSTLTLASSTPFSYLYDVPDLMDDFFLQSTTTTPTFALDLGFGTVTILSPELVDEWPMVDVLRTLISYGLWMGFAYVVYREVLRIHNKETV